MASIESLLNPLPSLPVANCFLHLPTPSPTISTSTAMVRSPRQKKPKMVKDAPIFQRGKPRGEVRYPPHGDPKGRFARDHHDFRLHPCGNIADYPRHIPYNSDKKSFQDRTGRESFEVFQYTFQMPGEEKQWTVMWDYNIGLVRTTHLFKCNDYSKTMPAKMLNQNPGLRDICHSITGGALAAQGYWMPYEAAKAVSATFCWKIRYALTPLFGADFPDLCVHPEDRSRFGRMIIDPSVVQMATEKANYYRMLELRGNSLRADYVLRPSSAPGRDRDLERDRAALGRHILPKVHHHHHHRSNTSTSTDTSLMGYGSSPEMEYYSSGTEPYCVSPVSPIRNSFTPVNTPRSTDIYPPTSSANFHLSEHDVLASLSSTSRARIRRLRASERAGPGPRPIPSSIPTSKTMRTDDITPPAEESDIDADAETDTEMDAEHDIDLDYEIGSSNDSSTSSTVSSGTSSSVSLNIPQPGPARLYRGGENDRTEPYRDTDEEMADYRAPKRIATTGAGDRKRGRRKRVYDQPHEARGGPIVGPSGRVQKHAPTPSDSRLMCEMTAAHALISLLHDTTGSDVDCEPRRKPTTAVKSERIDEKSHALGFGSSTTLSTTIGFGSGQKRRRASA
ncbi:hypothetical protein BDW74DRAFT_166160 [Aspergillus multicolor]|uniref:putative APSES transcription factor Xbp1 n=1 Tax=Aspergillus multicolor TaxID=41759 RepID=UPI003CCD53AB